MAERFQVSRPTIYDVLKRARLQEFTPRNSTNQRFKTLQYGLKRLVKVEQTIQGGCPIFCVKGGSINNAGAFFH
ncbi:hypothetical protein [Nitrosomonas sp.]|uniref:hypothetical protein n=1 Tax=Nitrosomonas sp. TaxID=42353 RepID=UPI0032EBB9CF